MGGAAFWTVIGVGVVAGLAAGYWPSLRGKWLASEMRRLRKEFHKEREHLEHYFITKARSSGKPRGLHWSDIEFSDDVTYARDRRTSSVTALVGITIQFEAVEGGGMEEVEFVRAPRDATAVFRVEQRKWMTDGRAIMNLNPTEAMRHYEKELELVAREHAKVVA